MGYISHFVLGVEIFLGGLLLFIAGSVFFFNRRKFLPVVFITFGIIASAILFYFIIPNPYELTHLPEYAFLSILILKAIEGQREKGKEKPNYTYCYFQSAVITGAIGVIDELYQGMLPQRYFNWYDILLNLLGSFLGLIIFFGIRRD